MQSLEIHGHHFQSIFMKWMDIERSSSDVILKQMCLFNSPVYLCLPEAKTWSGRIDDGIFG